MTPECDLPAVDGADQPFRARIRVSACIRLDRLEPSERRSLPVGPGDARHDGLEVRLTSGDADAPGPFGARQIHDRRGELCGGELRRVVGHHAHPGRHAHPLAVGRVEPRWRGGERRRIDGGEQALRGQVLQGRGILGVVDVGRRVRALGDDLVRQHVLVVGAQAHRDPALTFERRHQGVRWSARAARCTRSACPPRRPTRCSGRTRSAAPPPTSPTRRWSGRAGRPGPLPAHTLVASCLDTSPTWTLPKVRVP